MKYPNCMYCGRKCSIIGMFFMVSRDMRYYWMGGGYCDECGKSISAQAELLFEELKIKRIDIWNNPLFQREGKQK